jgi:phospholipid N-methyltransferase
MMPSRGADTLFQLIHSMEKAEKRAFKLYATRNSSNEDLKIIQLFDAIDKMNEYDETALLKKLQFTKKEQLANRKTHLYKQILASLRLLESNEHIDIQLHEQLDSARILYNKGLYLQSLKILEKIKEATRATHQDSYLLQALFLEKKIEALHITRSLKDRANQLATETNELMKRLQITSHLSNLALELYGWYINYGHARNEEDEKNIRTYFHESVSLVPEKLTGFYQKLYLYQSYCWFAFIRLDYLMYYRYTQKWVDIFHEEPQMIEIETGHYIKGMHNLTSAHFDLRNYEKFEQNLSVFENFGDSAIVKNNGNNNIQVFVYLYTAKINKHFMHGSFDEGLKLVPEITEKLKEYSLYLDAHRVLVFYYKIASLYFGSADYDNTIKYLSKIINWKVDLRNDLQCYARLLHLIAHYELGNYNLLEYLIKSVYRFMAKMDNLGVVEEEIFSFLHKAFHLSPKELKKEFEILLQKLKAIENDKLALRAFAYLDIISWLESKIGGVPVQEVIQKKYRERKKTSKHIVGE